MGKRKKPELEEKESSVANNSSVDGASIIKKLPYKRTFIAQANSLPIDTLLAQYLPEHVFEYEPNTDRLGRAVEHCTFQIALRTSPLSQDTDHFISDVELTACFNLIEQTSGDAYRASGFGWHPERKMREMKEEDMRYLLVRRNQEAAEMNGTIVAFTSFMLTYEDGYPVVYIYEIHLAPEVGRCGLGSHLLHTIESIGRSVGVDKTMLTVFRSNEHARAWYKKAGYEVDEYSPPDKKLRGGKIKQTDYLILSKELKSSG